MRLGSRKGLVLLLTLGIVSTVSHAEPRWCSILGLGSGENLAYSPIARVARLHGIVLERVIYLPNGPVQSFDFISGPRMLSASLEQQMKSWAIKTNQRGEQLCETLVIAKFDLDDSSGQSKSYPIDVSESGILRLKVATTPVCLCDPGGVLGRKPPFQSLGYGVKRMFAWFLKPGSREDD